MLRRPHLAALLLLLGCTGEPESPPPRDTGPCNMKCVSCPADKVGQYRCDPCTGETWRCDTPVCGGDTVNGDYPLAWTRGGYSCDCIDEDGNPLSDARCQDTITD